MGCDIGVSLTNFRSMRSPRFTSTPAFSDCGLLTSKITPLIIHSYFAHVATQAKLVGAVDGTRATAAAPRRTSSPDQASASPAEDALSPADARSVAPCVARTIAGLLRSTIRGERGQETRRRRPGAAPAHRFAAQWPVESGCRESARSAYHRWQSIRRSAAEVDENSLCPSCR